MSTHAKLSPSSRHRWGKCPASVREEAQYPERPSGVAAKDGTHTHTLLEHCLVTGNSATKFIGVTLDDHEGSFTVDKERAERVQFALDYIHANANAGQTVLAEKRVTPMGIEELSGTVDVQIIGKHMIEIIDYKDGVGIVDAKDNAQLEQYLIGALSELSLMDADDSLVLRMTIVQPKLRSFGQSGISSHDVNASDATSILDKIIVERDVASNPDAPHVPGESQCKYCAHKGACTALLNKSLSDSNVTFSDLTKSSDKTPSTMTDAQILEIMEAAPLLRQMIEGVEAEAQRRLEAGQAIAGLKLVKGRGSRQWMQEDDDIAAALKKFGLPKEAIYQTKLISVAQAEKATWTKRDGSTMQLSPVQIGRLKKEYVKQTDGKLQVALESDSRTAISTNASEMFSLVVPSWLS